jgi:hypothetical protein
LDVVEYMKGIPMELLEGSTGDKSIEDADDLVSGVGGWMLGGGAGFSALN